MNLGVVVPLAGLTLADHPPALAALAAAGYDTFWAGEADGLDAVTPLAAAATAVPTAAIGTAVLPAFTRGPGLLAMTAAGLAELAPGRASIGIGASSPAVVSSWNAVDHDRPFARVRDTVRFLRRAMTGERVSADYDTFRVDGFRLGRPPEQPPDLLVAGLRPRMLRLAATEADGAVTTNLPLGHVPRVVDELVAHGGGRLVTWVAVCPTDDAAAVRAAARPAVAAYFTSPPYAAYARWLGWGDLLEPLWSAWHAGDRRGAVASIPDQVVDELVIHGSPERCRSRLAAYRAAGVTDLAVVVHPAIVDPLDALVAVGGDTFEEH